MIIKLKNYLKNLKINLINQNINNLRLIKNYNFISKIKIKK